MNATDGKTQGIQPQGDDGPPPTSPPMPTKRGYWIGGAIIMVSVLAAGAIVVLGVLRMAGQVDDFERVPIPGETEVAFDDPGSYSVYYEGPGAGEGGDIPTFSVALTPTGGGDAIPFDDYDGSFTYDVPGHQGMALWTFSVERAGSYQLSVFDESREVGNLAVGRGVASTMVVPLVAAVILGLVGSCGGVAVLVMTFTKRRRAMGPHSPATTERQALPAVDGTVVA